MKFRDLYEGKIDKRIEKAMFKLIVDMKKDKKKTSEILKALEVNFPSYNTADFYANFKNDLVEADMKFQALAIAKDLHNKLAGLTFIDMLAVMSATNPAKKEVQDLESAINALTGEVGDFIQKYIPDVADAEVGDTEEKPEPEEVEEPEEEIEDEEEEKGMADEPEEEEEEKLSKDQKKKIKDNDKEIKESLDEATKGWKKIRSYILGQETDVYTNDSGYTFGKVDGKWVMVDFDDEVIHTGKSAAEMKRYFNSNLTEDAIEEASPVQDFKTLMYKTMYGKEYEMAIKVMQDEGISAADAARRFRHVDARALAELFKKYKR